MTTNKSFGKTGFWDNRQEKTQKKLRKAALVSHTHIGLDAVSYKRALLGAADVSYKQGGDDAAAIRLQGRVRYLAVVTRWFCHLLALQRRVLAFSLRDLLSTCCPLAVHLLSHAVCLRYVPAGLLSCWPGCSLYRVVVMQASDELCVHAYGFFFFFFLLLLRCRVPVPPAWVSSVRSQRAAESAAKALETMKCPPLSKARGILSKKTLRGATNYLVHWWPGTTSVAEDELGATRWISRDVLACSRLCVGYAMEFEVSQNRLSFFFLSVSRLSLRFA